MFNNSKNVAVLSGAAILFAVAGSASAQITQPLGNGWQVTIFDPANVFIDVVTSTPNEIQLRKRATVVGLTDEGIPRPIVINFQQIASSTVTAPRISILSETISNQSGVDWFAYRNSLVQSSRVVFNQTLSDLNPAPYLDTTYTPDSREVQYDNGVVANGATWNAVGQNGLVIDITLGQVPVIFVLKEIPVPTPGSMVLAGAGLLFAARRRR